MKKQPIQRRYLVVTDMRGKDVINAFFPCHTLKEAKEVRKFFLSCSHNGWKYPIFKEVLSRTQIKL